MEDRTRAEAEGVAARLLRTARFVRRLARQRRDEGDTWSASRLFVLATEYERDAERGHGPWWNVECGRQPELPLGL